METDLEVSTVRWIANWQTNCKPKIITCVSEFVSWVPTETDAIGRVSHPESGMTFALYAGKDMTQSAELLLVFITSTILVRL